MPDGDIQQRLQVILGAQAKATTAQAKSVRATSQAKAALEQLRAELVNGTVTTGDPIRDYVLSTAYCREGEDLLTQLEEQYQYFLSLQRTLTGKCGQLIMVARWEVGLHTVAYREPGPNEQDTHQDYELHVGILTGEQLVGGQRRELNFPTHDGYQSWYYYGYGAMGRHPEPVEWVHHELPAVYGIPLQSEFPADERFRPLLRGCMEINFSLLVVGNNAVRERISELPEFQEAFAVMEQRLGTLFPNDPPPLISANPQ
ncbi:MAG: hypothetical protein WC553_00890 [Patescibacteria group bacterium]